MVTDAMRVITLPTEPTEGEIVKSHPLFSFINIGQTGRIKAVQILLVICSSWLPSLNLLYLCMSDFPLQALPLFPSPFLTHTPPCFIWWHVHQSPVVYALLQSRTPVHSLIHQLCTSLVFLTHTAPHFILCSKLSSCWWLLSLNPLPPCTPLLLSYARLSHPYSPSFHLVFEVVILLHVGLLSQSIYASLLLRFLPCDFLAVRLAVRPSFRVVFPPTHTLISSCAESCHLAGRLLTQSSFVATHSQSQPMLWPNSSFKPWDDACKIPNSVWRERNFSLGIKRTAWDRRIRNARPLPLQSVE